MSMTKIISFNRDRRSPAAKNDRPNQPTDVPASRHSQGANALPSTVTDIREAKPAGADISVSIVVPTCGRPQLLNRCIASLVLQRFDASRFEIIIVDDDPSDDTREVATGWAAHTDDRGPQITYIPSMGPHGPAAARNHGWRAARGGIIAFTDDDTIARSDWLVNGVRAFGEDVHAVSGRIVMPLSGVPTDYQLDAKNLENAEFVTANCFCRRQVLEDIGGFDERFRVAWREDSDLHFRLLDYRAKIVHEPEAVMMHPIRPAGWGISLSQVKKMQFDALLFKKHPSLYRRKIRAKPRWDFYLAVGALLTCLIALLVGADSISLLAGGVWLYMTGRFCLQRLEKTSRSPAHVIEMIVTSALIPPLAVFWRAVGAIKFRIGLI
jgi:GT2 family glycosyltransferase